MSAAVASPASSSSSSASSAPTSIQLVDSLISYVQNLPSSSSSSSASSSSSSSLPHSSSSTTADVAWFPVVPVGHTAYTWYGEEGVSGHPIQHEADPFVSRSPKVKAAAAPTTTGSPATAPAPAPASSSASTESKTPAPKDSKPKKGGGGGAKPAPSASSSSSSSSSSDASVPDFAHLDIRVGQIVSAARHPDPTVESLYVEQIDVGEEKPREVVSGLVQFVPLEEFKKARVLVICNLKPSNLKGVTSYGMVLASSNADRSHVELITPPASAAVGSRITVSGLDVSQHSPAVNVDPKKKGNVWTKVAEGLKVNEKGEATWEGKQLVTKEGATCISKTLRNAKIS